MESNEAHDDPANELEALAHGLKRQVERRKRAGQRVDRRGPASASAAASPSAASGPISGPGAGSRAPNAPRAPAQRVEAPVRAPAPAASPTRVPAAAETPARTTAAASSGSSTPITPLKRPTPIAAAANAGGEPVRDVPAPATARTPASAAGSSASRPVGPPADRTAAPARATSDSKAGVTSSGSVAPRINAPTGVANAPTVASGPATSADDVRSQAAAAKDLDELRRGVAQCRACTLCTTRTQTVFLDGKGARKLMFVGEAPGADEDASGVPFVGRAGQLLTDIIQKGMGIPREEVWIANVLKCRPPNNREPSPVEKETCTPWLDRQIEMLDPTVIIPLGRHAAMHMLRRTATMGEMRGRIFELASRKVIPTFHPAYLLRSPGEKKECWKDIQVAMGVLGIAPKPGG